AIDVGTQPWASAVAGTLNPHFSRQCALLFFGSAGGENAGQVGANQKASHPGRHRRGSGVPPRTMFAVRVDRGFVRPGPRRLLNRNQPSSGAFDVAAVDGDPLLVGLPQAEGAVLALRNISQLLRRITPAAMRLLAGVHNPEVVL